MFGWGFRALALPSWLLLRQTLLQRLPVRGHGRWRPCLTIVVDLSGQGHEMSLVATLLFMRTFFAPSSRFGGGEGSMTCRHSLQLHVVNEAHTDLLKKQGRYKLCTNDGEASRSAAV